jgi:hypothetical protein
MADGLFLIPACLVSITPQIAGSTAADGGPHPDSTDRSPVECCSRNASEAWYNSEI